MYLIVLAVIFLVLCVLSVLYLSRPRAQELEALPAPDENNQKRRVAVVVCAPAEDDGLNQYTLPAVQDWCDTVGYDLYVFNHGSHVLHMRDMLADCKYDYLVGMSNQILVTTRKESLDHIFNHTELASSFEDCYTSWFCPNIHRAWSNGDLSQVWTPAMTESFLVVNTSHFDCVTFLTHIMDTGYIYSSYGVAALPRNLLANQTDWNTVSHKSPLLGYMCARSDQVKPIFENLSYSDSLASLDEVKARHHASSIPTLVPRTT